MTPTVGDQSSAMHKRTFKLPRLVTIVALAVASWLLILVVGWALFTLIT